MNIPSQRGKTVLITGANSGIGYQAAKLLATHGAQVVLGVRSTSKGEQAAARLAQEVSGARVEVLTLDLASLASVRSAAAQLQGRPLDVLINNAGVMAYSTRQTTEDGFERQFGTNHLGHFALTGLLMPSLLAAPAPRVVTVASLAHRNGRIRFDDLNAEQRYVPWEAYGQSKLANILFARELARRAAEQHSRLLSVAVHPGIARTSIIENGPGSSGLKAKILPLIAPILMQSDADGALPSVYGATAEGLHGGDYIGPGGFLEFKGQPKLVTPRPHALDAATARRLWEVSEQLTGVVYPPLA